MYSMLSYNPARTKASKIKGCLDIKSLLTTKVPQSFVRFYIVKTEIGDKWLEIKKFVTPTTELDHLWHKTDLSKYFYPFFQNFLNKKKEKRKLG